MQQERNGQKTPAGEVEAGGRQMLTILAAPFRHAGRLRRFMTDVEHLPGVESVTPLEFRHGVLSLHVVCTGAPPLAGSLRALAGFDLSIEQNGDQIKVALPDEEDGWR